MVFQRIFNAHTCLRQLRFVLNILPKLASLTCDQTQHRRFPSTHLKLHIISYYVNNQKCRSEVCWRYVACCKVQIDRANTLEDYPRTHRRDFHQLNTKHRPQMYCLVHFLKFDAVLWVFQRILMHLGCPFLKPHKHSVEDGTIYYGSQLSPIPRGWLLLLSQVHHMRLMHYE